MSKAWSLVLFGAFTTMLLFVETSMCEATGKEKALYNFNCTSGNCNTSNANDINLSGMIFDKEGNLYGASISELSSGSNCDGYACGYIFELMPTKSGSWTEKTLYNFCSLASCADGAVPLAGLVFDTSGNLYGTTGYGGTSVPGCGGLGCGTVFELTPTKSGEWSETVLYNFTGEPDGSGPSSTPIFDKTGNLYGTTVLGGAYGYGTVFKLTADGGGKWTESILHSFQNNNNVVDGTYPLGSIAFDKSGKLYGSTGSGGKYSGPLCVDGQENGTNCGIIYQLAPNGSGGWAEHILHSFQDNQEDAVFPIFGVILDAEGNVYGATEVGGKYSAGTVFELVHGTWAESIFSFEAPNGSSVPAGGCFPLGGVILSKSGSLYGTTSGCGLSFEEGGVAYELSPANGSWNQTVLWDFSAGTDGYEPLGPLVQNASGDLFGLALGGGTGNDGVAFEVVP